MHPVTEGLEGRQLLTAGARPASLSPAEFRSLVMDPIGYPTVRPNTPVLPFGAVATAATYIDPSVGVTNGRMVVLGTRSFIGPFANLNASDGVVKIGGGTVILDNVSITANPTHSRGVTPFIVRIGDGVEVSYGAVITGPTAIGAYGHDGKPTFIGPGAVIDAAVIEPGAFVSALARVGPGVTVPSGMKVLPGASVTTDAEASDPALGKVTPVTEADVAEFGRSITANLQLAVGYITVYQGRSTTGARPGAASPSIFNGDLSAILGAGPQPGAPTTFLPAGPAPLFPSPHRGPVQGSLSGFPARSTGQAVFHQRARDVVAAVGRRNAIRADQGQPITIGSIAQTGSGVTINAPFGGSITIGERLTAADRAVILGGSTGTHAVLGDDVSIGSGAVVQGSSLGNGVVIGAGSYVRDSHLPAGAIVPPGSIYINGTLVGQIGG